MTRNTRRRSGLGAAGSALNAQISRFSGNISRTAEFVGMERSALHRKLKALGVG
jgi:DNA-binding NtrC family response regulator